VEHQHAALQTLYPALLLIAGPLQPAIHRYDLSHRQALGLDDSLSLGTLLARVKLGNPYTHSAVRAPEPFESGIGQEVRGNAIAQPVRTGAASQKPTGDTRHQCEEDEPHWLGHSRSQPRRRNQR
jgi:hypothetical protein